MSSYEAGVCNIGEQARRRRLLLGLLGLLAAAGYTVWMVSTGRPTEYVAGTFLLSTGGFLGILQDRLKFCVGNASMGTYDFEDDAGEVDDAQRRRRDYRRAFELTVYAIALGLATTLLTYVLFLSPLSAMAG